MPKMPSSAPQTDRESRMMAELSPITLPIIFGVRMVSCMVCTTAKTMSAISRMNQKFSPVSAALTIARMMVGMNPNNCR